MNGIDININEEAMPVIDPQYSVYWHLRRKEDGRRYYLLYTKGYLYVIDPISLRVADTYELMSDMDGFLRKYGITPGEENEFCEMIPILYDASMKIVPDIPFDMGMLADDSTEAREKAELQRLKSFAMRLRQKLEGKFMRICNDSSGIKDMYMKIEEISIYEGAAEWPKMQVTGRCVRFIVDKTEDGENTEILRGHSYGTMTLGTADSIINIIRYQGGADGLWETLDSEAVTKHIEERLEKITRKTLAHLFKEEDKDEKTEEEDSKNRVSKG